MGHLEIGSSEIRVILAKGWKPGGQSRDGLRAHVQKIGSLAEATKSLQDC